MPLEESAAVARNIITFGGTGAEKASKLNYDVPLPGAIRNRRIIELRGLNLSNGDWKQASGIELASEIALVQSPEGKYTFDKEKAINFWIGTAKANGVAADKIAILEQWYESPSLAASAAGPVHPIVPSARGRRGMGPVPGQGGLPEDPIITDLIHEFVPEIDKFQQRLKEGFLRLPYADNAGGMTTNDVPVEPVRNPVLLLVEIYQVSSFYGDYGLGRTVKTMSFLPTERMNVKVRVWRSSEKSIKVSSSIFDSATTESQARFNQQVRNETTDKNTQSKKEEWHAEAKADATWGWGSAEVSGGGSGEYHSGREQFSSAVNDSVQEHAQNASQNRETTVTSNSEQTMRSEDEETTERESHNPNVRRTLNFVFRELNQTYATYVHLVDVRLAYTDGTPNSWREVPLSGMRGLLTEVLDESKVDQTAGAILDLIDVVFDHADQPHKVLERVSWNAASRTFDPAESAAPEADGSWLPPTKDRTYRYRRGIPIGQDDAEHQVEGVVVKKSKVTLRTDSLLVESLLGQADALDDYGLASQKADAEAKLLANQRAESINTALGRITDAEKRLTLATGLLHPDGPIKIEMIGGNGTNG